MNLFRQPTIQKMREKMLYQAQCELLQAESMKEAYDAQVQMLKNRILRLNLPIASKPVETLRGKSFPEVVGWFDKQSDPVMDKLLNGEWDVSVNSNNVGESKKHG